MDEICPFGGQVGGLDGFAERAQRGHDPTGGIASIN
jgi:hypothetical protein